MNATQQLIQYWLLYATCHCFRSVVDAFFYSIIYYNNIVLIYINNRQFVQWVTKFEEQWCNSTKTCGLTTNFGSQRALKSFFVCECKLIEMESHLSTWSSPSVYILLMRTGKIVWCYVFTFDHGKRWFAQWRIDKAWID